MSGPESHATTDEHLPNPRPQNGTASSAALTAWAAVVFGLPLLALVGLVARWRPPTPADLIVLVTMYSIAGLGISIGWHRFFTHKSFVVGRTWQVVFAIAGSLAFEGSLASWVANHRVHHAHTDEPLDPHTPWHANSRLTGFAHAHIGWLRSAGAPVDRLARDVQRDPALRKISDRWWLWALVGITIPAVAAGSIAGIDAAVSMLLWAGLIRVVVFHHVTWSVNSICHMFGTRLFETTDRSTNVAWLAIPSFGEAWHNNHHAHPRAARHGMGRWQVDVSAALIRVLERCGAATGCHWPNKVRSGVPDNHH